MSNYYLCETCAVKHVGGSSQSFMPYLICSIHGVLEHEPVMRDDLEPKELCRDYKPKVVDE